MPAVEYFATDALGSTDVKNLLRSPAHFLTQRASTKSSRALELGTLIHECILEPELWLQRKVVGEINRRTKAGRAEWERLTSSPAPWVTKADRELCDAIRDAVLKNRLVCALLEQATQRELACFWENDGVDCKARIDAYGENGLLLDVKTTQDASMEGFRSSIARYRYHVQAAHYASGVYRVTDRWPDFAFIAVEKEPPFSSAVYVLDEEAMGAGLGLCERAYRVFRNCSANRDWRAYPERIQTISLPRWAAEEANDE